MDPAKKLLEKPGPPGIPVGKEGEREPRWLWDRALLLESDDSLFTLGGSWSPRLLKDNLCFR